MGAHNFETSAYAETAVEAFNDLCDEARYNEGHNAYNGTISTNDSFTIVEFEEGESVSDWMQRVPDDEGIQKWGPCACVKDPDIVDGDGRPLWHFAGWASC